MIRIAMEMMQAMIQKIAQKYISLHIDKSHETCQFVPIIKWVGYQQFLVTLPSVPITCSPYLDAIIRWKWNHSNDTMPNSYTEWVIFRFEYMWESLRVLMTKASVILIFLFLKLSYLLLKIHNFFFHLLHIMVGLLTQIKHLPCGKC